MPIAALDWEMIAPMLIALGVFVVLPIVALLLKHQRFMAELVHRNLGQDAAIDDRLRRMEAEMGVLKDRLNSQILNADPGRAEIGGRVGSDRNLS